MKKVCVGDVYRHVAGSVWRIDEINLHKHPDTGRVVGTYLGGPERSSHGEQFILWWINNPDDFLDGNWTLIAEDFDGWVARTRAAHEERRMHSGD